MQPGHLQKDPSPTQECQQYTSDVYSFPRNLKRAEMSTGMLAKTTLQQRVGIVSRVTIG